MKMTKSGMRLTLAVVLCANLATVAWATCWYTPFSGASRSGCNRAGTYNYYAPDPQTSCGWNGNPYSGCVSSTASLLKRSVAYSDSMCTLLPILADSGWTNTGTTVPNDYANSCYGA